MEAVLVSHSGTADAAVVAMSCYVVSRNTRSPLQDNTQITNQT